MELETVARHVDDVGVALTEASGRIGIVHPGAAFEGDGHGAFGELTRALARAAAAAIAARAAEARAVGGAATDLAAAALRATSSYRGTDSGTATASLSTGGA